MNKELTITQAHIENRIFTVRGVQVMLDRDLAEMYQVETKVLNQATKRNPERFPVDFMFQLTHSEWENLMSQNTTLKNENLKSQNVTSSLRSHFVTLKNNRGKHRKYLPFVFTEQGVAGLSGVLRSESATKVHVAVMRTFVAMRKLIQDNQLIYSRLDRVERKQLETDQKFEQIFKALEGNTTPRQGVFFNGQVFDAYELASKIIRTAQQSIVLIDNYIDESTFAHLAKKKLGISVVILTKAISKQLTFDLQKVNEQYGNFALKAFTESHDRFLIIDHKEIYHLGASLKDLGKKWFAFSKMEKSIVSSILEKISKLNCMP